MRSPLDEAFDALRGSVETRREVRNLVSSFDLDPGAQVPAAQGLDPILEPLQAPCDPPGERVRTDCEDGCEQGQPRQPAQPPARATSVRLTGDEPAAVRQGKRERTAAAGTMEEASVLHEGGRGREVVGGCGEERTVGVEERQLRLEVGSEPHERAREFRTSRARRRQQAHRQDSRTMEVSRMFVASPVQVPSDRHQHREHREYADEGEVDAEIETSPPQSRILASM